MLATGCPPGGTVLDPFVGGGTTLAVAQSLDSTPSAWSSNSTFCDVTVRRVGGAAPTAEPGEKVAARSLRRLRFRAALGHP